VTRTVHSCTRPISKRKRRRRKTARIQRLSVSPLIRLDNECLCNLLHNLLRRRLSRPLRVPRLDLRLRSLDLLHQKVNPLVRAHAVRQVCREHRQSAQADSITRLADNLDLVGGEVLDLVAVLQLLRVAVEDNTSDLILDACVELLDRAVVHGSALGVAACDDDRVRALRRHVLKGRLEHALGDGVCAAWEHVGRDQGAVGYAFCGDFVGAECFLQTVGGRGADDGALPELVRWS
jgi:hypothetical protein